MIRRLKCILAAAMFIVISLAAPSKPCAFDRSTPSVPPDSALYRDLDKLVAFKLASPPILGQRPYPRSEFARMTAEAMRKMAAVDEGGAETLKEFRNAKERRWQVDISLRRLKDEFREELVDMGAIEGEKGSVHVHGLKEMDIYNRYLDSPPTTLPPNNGRGRIDATINPLGDYNLGRHAIDGYTGAYETVSYVEASKFFSAYASPRLEVDGYRKGDMQGHAYLQNGYGTFKAGNFSLKVGRDSQVWGFGERGSLLFSTNPRPLDGMWVTNPTPARLPWVFKHLGKWRYTLYGVNLGPGNSVKWSWLTGYKISLMPCDYVELGFGHAVTIGGEGTPTPSFVDVIGEFFGFRPAGTSKGSTNFSNHTFEIDLLLRLVPLRGTELYADVAIEDKWKSIMKTLKQGMSYLGGMYIPALNPSGSMDLRMEFVRTSPLQYRHSRYSSGFTLNRLLIGSDAGPDAYTAHLQFRHTLSPAFFYGVTADWDYRRSNTYRELRNSNGSAGDIIKVKSGPTEVRYRGVLDVNMKIKKYATLDVAAGFERVSNIFFVEGMHRSNFLAGVNLELDLDRFFSFSSH
jgi:hypothetical protein